MISDSEAQEMLDSRDLIAIGVRADDLRRRLHGGRTTFVRVFEMHVDAPPASLPSGTSAGEFRIVGRPASLDAAMAAVRSATRIAGGVAVTGFSLVDLLALDGASSLAAACRALREAGLEAIARATGRDASVVAAEALERFLEYDAWYVAEIEQAMPVLV